MTDPKPVECWLTDMDGVLVHESHAVPGAAEFVAALQQTGRRFLLLTNNSIYTRRDLRARLLAGGIDVPESSIWTSALAAAQFLDDQRAGGSAYVIGEAGLTTALHEVGYVLTERRPDYVVLGETLGSMHANYLAPEGMVAVGVDINATHTGSATSGTVTGVCAPIHVGRSVAVHEIAITDEHGRRCSTVRITNFYKPAP